MATSGLRIEEFNPRSQDRPEGRFWFVDVFWGIQPSEICQQSVSGKHSRLPPLRSELAARGSLLTAFPTTPRTPA